MINSFSQWLIHSVRQFDRYFCNLNYINCALYGDSLILKIPKWLLWILCIIIPWSLSGTRTWVPQISLSPTMVTNLILYMHRHLLQVKKTRRVIMSEYTFEDTWACLAYVNASLHFDCQFQVVVLWSSWLKELTSNAKLGIYLSL